MKQTGIVLQGGGALGAYEMGVLKRLYEQKDFSPDIVSGVSIGAINAAAIVGSQDDNPITTLQKIWERFEVISPLMLPDAMEPFLSLFGNMSFYRMRYDYFNILNWTSCYTVEPLKAVLEECIDYEKIAESKKHLLLTATNIQTGKVEVFDNRSHTIGPDHVMASGSLPPGFPMTEIGDKSYWDGGLFDNTPLVPVIEAFDTDPKTEKELIVVNLFPTEGIIPNNMLEVFDRSFEIVFSNKVHKDMKTLERVNDFVDFAKEIDQFLDADNPIREMPGFKKLQQYTRIDKVTYITNTRSELVFAPFDFSKESLSERIRAGYEDADKALG